MNGLLNISPNEFENLSNLVIERLIRQMQDLPSSPALSNAPYSPEFNRISPDTIFPREGLAPEEVLSQLFEKYEYGRKPTHPAHLTLLSGGGVSSSALADLIAKTMNKHTGFVDNCPGLVDMELCVIKWLCSIIYGQVENSEPFGFLTSGGTIAIWSAFSIALNEKNRKLSSAYLSIHPMVVASKFRIYLNDQTHFSTVKCATLLGFSAENIVIVPTNDQFTYDLPQLENKIEQDRQEGWIPFLLIGNAGTVNTGTVDDLLALSGIAKKFDMWFHIDGCYGGFYKLAAKRKDLFLGIDKADSITLDPHKGLFLPFGTGCMLTKDIHAIKRTYQITQLGPYVLSQVGKNQMISPDELQYYDFADITPELTRPFRGIRLWLPLKLHGVKAFEDAISERIEVTQYFYEGLKSQLMNQIQFFHKPSLSVMVFRFIKSNDDQESEIEGLNIKIVECVNERQNVSILHTRLKGKLALRIIFSSFKPDKKIADLCISELKQAYRIVTETRLNTPTP